MTNIGAGIAIAGIAIAAAVLEIHDIVAITSCVVLVSLKQNARRNDRAKNESVAAIF